MSTLIGAAEIERRLSVLEGRLTDTIAIVSDNELRLRLLERRPRSGSIPPPVGRPLPPVPVSAWVAPMLTADDDPAPARDEEPRRAWLLEVTSLSDFLGGRALAWLGGIATLLGIVLLLGLAISHGWIGPPARVALAAAGSTALLSAGAWLHARRGRTEAAVVMVGTATASWFATVTVATEVYALIPPLAGIAAAMIVGGLATALAIRWAGRAIAVLGLIGALVSPLLVGAPENAVTLALLAVGAMGAMCVVCWRRWPWLAFATMLVCAPQWALWLAAGQQSPASIAVLLTFGAIGLLGALGTQLRAPERNMALVSASALVLLNALIIGTAGRLAFGPSGGAVWLAGMAAVHAGTALWRWPRLPLNDTFRRLLISVGVVAADVALASTLHGVALTAAWGVSSIGFAVLVRRTGHGAPDEAWLEAGLGTHIGLVALRALLELSPAQLTSGPELVPMTSCAILAMTSLASARLSADRSFSRMLLDCLGLVAVAYMTAATLQGVTLVVAWAVEAVALAEIARRVDDPVARYGSLAFLAAVALHTLALEAPASGLVSGVDSLSAATVAVAATASAALRLARLAGPSNGLRRALLAGSGVAGLYLASLAIITAFQPAAGTESVIVLDLGVRQQGQVLLSALWGVVGVAALVAGLRRNIAMLRTGALALLMATVAKVFFYDLSTLTSIYRVVSFLVLGGLLLAGAFAYQRLRLPPPPDLRALHASQR